MAAWKNARYDYDSAINLKHIFTKAFVKELALKDSEITGRSKRGGWKEQEVKKVFTDFLHILIDEMIEKNYVFVAPLKDGFKIYIRQKKQEAMDQIIKRGKTYKNVDLIKSDFTIYEFVLRSKKLYPMPYRGFRIPHKKYKQLVKKVNEGMRYFEE